MRKLLYFLTIALLGLMVMSVTSVARAQLPEFGLPVPQLAVFDDTMQVYMAANGIDAGVLAVSRNSVVVYQRGFGIGIEENTPMRIASVEKPITAAAIRILVNDNLLSLNQRAFNLGQNGGGILPHQPWNGLGDARLSNITVQHLINHVGGWDRDTAAIRDPMFATLQIAQAMGGSYPADRDDIIRYMLSEPLQFSPGMNGCLDGNDNPFYCYSNFGYLVLGRIIETISGQSLYDFVQSRVLTAQMWLPAGSYFKGRSLPANRHPQEPYYQGNSANCTNIFNPAGPRVNCPDGNWHQEAFMGHGNLVSTLAPLMVLMDRYQIAVQNPIGAVLNPGEFGGGTFNGALNGLSSTVRQRSDGINIGVMLSRRNDVDHAIAVSAQISNIISNQTLNWPTRAADGYWVDSNVPGNDPHLGSYNTPFRNINQALAEGAGVKLRLKATQFNWTGLISNRTLIDAPLGTARIGG